MLLSPVNNPVEMPQSDEEYLLMLWDKGICPNCGGTVREGARFGSGRKSDGGFCSLDCYGEYHKTAIVERHKKLLATVYKHRNS